jgi:DNA-binding CsgD family transcriptional regulator
MRFSGDAIRSCGFWFHASFLSCERDGVTEVKTLSEVDALLAQEVPGGLVFNTFGDAPALAQLPQGSELSARQTDTVARLAAGQRVSDIARSMFLSPSTVRNHLAATYRKFRVHSQAELLAALFGAIARQRE